MDVLDDIPSPPDPTTRRERYARGTIRWTATMACLGLTAYYLHSFFLVSTGWGVVGQQVASRFFPETIGLVDKVKYVQVNEQARIKYSFYVDEIKYEGNLISFGDFSLDGQAAVYGKSKAQTFISEHPIGSNITIFYSPQDPSRCILQPGLQGGNLLIVMLTFWYAEVLLVVWWASALMVGTLVQWILMCNLPRAKFEVIDLDGASKKHTRLQTKFAFPLPAMSLMHLGKLSLWMAIPLLILGFALTGFDQKRPPYLPLPLMIAAWIFFLSVSFFVLKAELMMSGHQNIMVDITGRVIYPPCPHGEHREESYVDMSSIVDVLVVEEIKQESDTGQATTRRTIHVVRHNDRGSDNNDVLLYQDSCKSAVYEVLGFLLKSKKFALENMTMQNADENAVREISLDTPLEFGTNDVHE